MNSLFTNFSLKQFNTFGIDVTASGYFPFDQTGELINFLKETLLPVQPMLILGGGSNILFTQNFEGLVIHPQSKGIKVIKESDTHIWIKVAAGECWDDLVNYCVGNNWGGIENLSKIPGNTGAAPVQNIGAYGSEVKDNIVNVEVINLQNFSALSIPNAACEFGYRESIFKKSAKGRYLVTAITLKLSKNTHAYNLSYANLKSEVEKYGEINLANIRNTIIAVRESKLPDPKTIANAGSFFKNPVVSFEKAALLKNQFPGIPVYPFSSDAQKIAAGWLIEQCGWKGRWINNAGVHEKQALVLISNGKATGEEILQLAKQIIESVNQKFEVLLEPEVNII